ncbi:hypothetical protein QJQ45_005568 [Haematococcus lacustris]|nr:hypothetical protein QJQ45_005568 [Haematococcus lacustris]
MAKRSRIRGLMCSISNVIKRRFYDRGVSVALNIRRIAAGPGCPRELSSWLGRPAPPQADTYEPVAEPSGAMPSQAGEIPAKQKPLVNEHRTSRVSSAVNGQQPSAPRKPPQASCSSQVPQSLGPALPCKPSAARARLLKPNQHHSQAEPVKLPAKGKEYPERRYKRLRDKPPKAQQQQQQQQQQPAGAQ